MKKIISLGILVAIVIACVVTCPDRNVHKQIVSDELNEALVGELPSGEGFLEKGLRTMVGFAGSSVFSTIIDTSLRYNNYFVLSTSSISYNGEDKILSIGLLGHVFTTFDGAEIAKSMGN